ncbi:hypothetical protein [Acinetobacter lanii]|uniref:Uncharacterized protein n=1 Tax=Acinetobacter lanii TaxID=2715163 RepID=A0A6G8S6Z0_9GAMM|nr:hypothetical protein [Acinetobacter lanii]QIO09945.1 hypothetical protein G8D99_13595 [Acinetobacter lanii]
MKQLEINEIIREINEKSIVFVELEKELENYPTIRKIERQLTNPDNEWKYLYHLGNKTGLRDWLDVLSEIYYQIDVKKPSELKPILEKLELVSRKLLALIQESLNIEEISSDDLKFASDLTKYLRQYKNFRFLTTELNDFKKEISKVTNTLNNLNVENDNLERIKNSLSSSLTESEDILKDLKDKKAFLNNLTDEITNSEIKTLYDKIHEDEKTLADLYRNWALGIFAIVGIILVLGFMNISIQNWNHLKDSSYIHIPLGWESLIKTLMLFSLTTPAWYLTRESSKHRKVAYKAQMLGTELASFPLYVREFKDEDRLELRKQLADRFFGQELYSDVKNSTSSDNSLGRVLISNNDGVSIIRSV